eukprot:CAMPEP_0178993632 /NCGR_PEP_ID=MMETSP0795-20121207/6810_1 /TAXON_ID=88552 /ORGANISM="Amoebophrya sp., Strain Ameob2" /LENGTH=1489 /DNA_ID=CAMNT_0020685711 /DNA_START=186 /DNA_END=4655 /DNA_ORIENTATION=-
MPGGRRSLVQEDEGLVTRELASDLLLLHRNTLRNRDIQFTKEDEQDPLPPRYAPGPDPEGEAPGAVEDHARGAVSVADGHLQPASSSSASDAPLKGSGVLHVEPMAPAAFGVPLEAQAAPPPTGNQDQPLHSNHVAASSPDQLGLPKTSMGVTTPKHLTPARGPGQQEAQELGENANATPRDRDGNANGNNPPSAGHPTPLQLRSCLRSGKRGAEQSALGDLSEKNKKLLRSEHRVHFSSNRKRPGGAARTHKNVTPRRPGRANVVEPPGGRPALATASSQAGAASTPNSFFARIMDAEEEDRLEQNQKSEHREKGPLGEALLAAVLEDDDVVALDRNERGAANAMLDEAMVVDAGDEVEDLNGHGAAPEAGTASTSLPQRAKAGAGQTGTIHMDVVTTTRERDDRDDGEREVAGTTEEGAQTHVLHGTEIPATLHVARVRPAPATTATSAVAASSTGLSNKRKKGTGSKQTVTIDADVSFFGHHGEDGAFGFSGTSSSSSSMLMQDELDAPADDFLGGPCTKRLRKEDEVRASDEDHKNGHEKEPERPTAFGLLSLASDNGDGEFSLQPMGDSKELPSTFELHRKIDEEQMLPSLHQHLQRKKSSSPKNSNSLLSPRHAGNCSQLRSSSPKQSRSPLRGGGLTAAASSRQHKLSSSPLRNSNEQRPRDSLLSNREKSSSSLFHSVLFPPRNSNGGNNLSVGAESSLHVELREYEVSMSVNDSNCSWRDHWRVRQQHGGRMPEGEEDPPCPLPYTVHGEVVDEVEERCLEVEDLEEIVNPDVVGAGGGAGFLNPLADGAGGVAGNPGHQAAMAFSGAVAPEEGAVRNRSLAAVADLGRAGGLGLAGNGLVPGMNSCRTDSKESANNGNNPLNASGSAELPKLNTTDDELQAGAEGDAGAAAPGGEVNNPVVGFKLERENYENEIGPGGGLPRVYQAALRPRPIEDSCALPVPAGGGPGPEAKPPEKDQQRDNLVHDEPPQQTTGGLVLIEGAARSEREDANVSPDLAAKNSNSEQISPELPLSANLDQARIEEQPLPLSQGRGNTQRSSVDGPGGGTSRRSRGRSSMGPLSAGLLRAGAGNAFSVRATQNSSEAPSDLSPANLRLRSGSGIGGMGPLSGGGAAASSGGRQRRKSGLWERPTGAVAASQQEDPLPHPLDPVVPKVVDDTATGTGGRGAEHHDAEQRAAAPPSTDRDPGVAHRGRVAVAPAARSGASPARELDSAAPRAPAPGALPEDDDPAQLPPPPRAQEDELSAQNLKEHSAIAKTSALPSFAAPRFSVPENENFVLGAAGNANAEANTISGAGARRSSAWSLELSPINPRASSAHSLNDQEQSFMLDHLVEPRELNLNLSSDGQPHEGGHDEGAAAPPAAPAARQGTCATTRARGRRGQLGSAASGAPEEQEEELHVSKNSVLCGAAGAAPCPSPSAEIGNTEQEGPEDTSSDRLQHTSNFDVSAENLHLLRRPCSCGLRHKTKSKCMTASKKSEID